MSFYIVYIKLWKKYCFITATIALAVPELPTVKAAASFLVNFILQSGDKGNLMNVVNACGQQLVFQIISCIGN